MRVATKVYLLKRGGKVLLAPKRGGEWDGHWDGYGGKVNKKESTLACAVRETRQEAKVALVRTATRQVAIVRTFRNYIPVFELHVFTCAQWEGTPVATREMGDPHWFTRGFLPLKMRQGDYVWLSRVLQGETFMTELFFESDGTLLRPPVFNPHTFS